MGFVPIATPTPSMRVPSSPSPSQQTSTVVISMAEFTEFCTLRAEKNLSKTEIELIRKYYDSTVSSKDAEIDALKRQLGAAKCQVDTANAEIANLKSNLAALHTAYGYPYQSQNA
jgi:hypothetical protein